MQGRVERDRAPTHSRISTSKYTSVSSSLLAFFLCGSIFILGGENRNETMGSTRWRERNNEITNNRLLRWGGWMDGGREGRPTDRQGVHTHNTFFLRAAYPTSDSGKNSRLATTLRYVSDNDLRWSRKSHSNDAVSHLISPSSEKAKEIRGSNQCILLFNQHFHSVSGTHNFFVVVVCGIIWRLAMAHTAAAPLLMNWWGERRRKKEQKGKMEWISSPSCFLDEFFFLSYSP